jgi:hypothetical protein
MAAYGYLYLLHLRTPEGHACTLEVQSSARRRDLTSGWLHHKIGCYIGRNTITGYDFYRIHRGERTLVDRHTVEPETVEQETIQSTAITQSHPTTVIDQDDPELWREYFGIRDDDPNDMSMVAALLPPSHPFNCPGPGYEWFEGEWVNLSSDWPEGYEPDDEEIEHLNSNVAAHPNYTLLRVAVYALHGAVKRSRGHRAAEMALFFGGRPETAGPISADDAVEDILSCVLEAVQCLL